MLRVLEIPQNGASRRTNLPIDSVNNVTAGSALCDWFDKVERKLSNRLHASRLLISMASVAVRYKSRSGPSNAGLAPIVPDEDVLGGSKTE